MPYIVNCYGVNVLHSLSNISFYLLFTPAYFDNCTVSGWKYETENPGRHRSIPINVISINECYGIWNQYAQTGRKICTRNDFNKECPVSCLFLSIFVCFCLFWSSLSIYFYFDNFCRFLSIFISFTKRSRPFCLFLSLFCWS